MTDHNLPDPLVPPEVDLTDFKFMPLDVNTLLRSSLWIKAKNDPRIAHAAVSLWCESWHQVPAGSLPDDEEVLATLAMCDTKEWDRIKDRALLHFVKCSDGRLYHRLVAEKAVEAWKHKQAQRAKTKAATAARGARSRSQQSSTDVQRDDQRHDNRDVGRDEQRDKQRHVARDDDRDDIRDVHQGTGTGTGTVKGQASGVVLPPLSRAPVADAPEDPGSDGPPVEPWEAQPNPPEDRPSTAGHQPTAAGLACRAMRAAGLQGVNPSDPRLQALLDLGVTQAELADVATEAVGKAKGWAWVLAVVKARREDADGMVGQGGTARPSPKPQGPGVPSNDDFDRYRRDAEELASRTPEQIAASKAARDAAMARLKRPEDPAEAREVAQQMARKALNLPPAGGRK